MGSFREKDKPVLQQLVSDCVNYGFSEKESLAYIKARFGREISSRSYHRFKVKVESGEHANDWLNYFTKVGFVINHKQIIDVIEMIQKDIVRDYLIEQNKPNKNKYEIRQLRFDIRDNAKLLQELALGTPIVAQIKAKIQELEKKNAELLQASV
jgi:hypothetical protein